MEETTLIECSRQSSIEGTVNNQTVPAEWTCECGNGLVLDIGDKIQLHSGFVSEKGAEAGKIEIKERDREFMEVEVSKDIQYGNPQDPIIIPRVNGTSYFPADQSDIYRFASERGGTEKRQILLNDGETNIVFSPYKTTNGEFYAGLPRRHIGWNASIKANGSTDNTWDTFDQSGRDFVDVSNPNRGLVGGIYYSQKAGLDPGRPGNLGLSIPYQYAPADKKGIFYPGARDGRSGGYPTGTNVPIYPTTIVRNDCSRYTIFRMKDVYRTGAAANASGGSVYAGLGGDDSVTASASGTEAFQDRVDRRDPAILGDWEQVKELFTMKSKSGFNSPLDVATEITDQMNRRGDLINASAFDGTDYNLATAAQPNSMTLLGQYTSPLHKPYNCASMLWNASRWDAFRDVRNTVNASELIDAHMYMSMYQHIGVKRPELWKQGRATNASQGFLKPDVVGGGGDSPVISQCLNLGMRWTEENLLNLNKLFVVQGNYPELFDKDIKQSGLPGLLNTDPQYRLQGVDKHRFIHINKQDEDDGADSHFPSYTLGYDLYGPREGAATPPGYKYDYTMSSYPLFFDYNKDIKHFNFNDVGFCEDSAGGISDINDLAYGWARKMRISGALSVSGEDEFYIGIQFTRTGNRIPEYLFNGKSHISQTGKGGRRWGFDYHFCAYGSNCIVLYSGIVDRASTGQDSNDKLVPPLNSTGISPAGAFTNFLYGNSYADLQSVGGAPLMSANYNTGGYYRSLLLGADSPALSYDSQQNRFSFTNLHISERGSNVYNAGRVASGTITAVNANTNADVLCYKVNKALLGNSYCPNMAPYVKGMKIPADRTYPEQLLLPNGFDAWQPYDATAGLFIEEIVVPEKTWNENLIGVLGFYYSQFDNTDTTRQATINTRTDSNNLKSLTTQAPIRSSDMLEWTKNGYGNNTYSLTLPQMYTRGYTSAGGQQPNQFKNIAPPATIFFPSSLEASTKITAIDLPTKTARPYYSIRSDILPQSQFIGGNQDLTKATSGAVNRPVIGIVNKVNGYGDFYSGADNQVVFTNTEKRVITSIKTSVHDPDGSYSKVNQSSAVIYKIIKQKQIDLTPVQTLLQSKNKQEALQGQQAASMLKDINDQQPNYSQTFNFVPPSQEVLFQGRTSS